MPVLPFTLLVSLLVSTQSGMTASGISALKQQVEAIYADLGVHLEWVEPSVPEALTVTIVRTLPAIGNCESALGCTVRDTQDRTPTRAYVATEAIRIEGERHTQARQRLVGFVVSHEIGHLLGLPHSTPRSLMFRNTYWVPDVEWTKEDRINVKRAFDSRALAKNSTPPNEPLLATDTTVLATTGVKTPAANR